MPIDPLLLVVTRKKHQKLLTAESTEKGRRERGEKPLTAKCAEKSRKVREDNPKRFIELSLPSRPLRSLRLNAFEVLALASVVLDQLPVFLPRQIVVQRFDPGVGADEVSIPLLPRFEDFFLL